MDKRRLDTLHIHGVALDTETHLIQPGLKAPPLVCGSIGIVQNGAIAGQITDKPQTRAVFEALLHKPDAVIIGANIAYDMLVLAVDAAKRGIDLMPAIFKAYEEGRVYDLQIAEQLHAIANGTLGKDPRTGRPLRDPHTGRPAWYSLLVVTDLVLGRTNAKQNDRFRLSYALLEDIPIAEWPPEARIYPVDDAVNTLEVALAQTGHLDRTGYHYFAHKDAENCKHCGVSVYESQRPCTARKYRNRNLHDLSNQCYTHFAMCLGAAWGFTVDHAAVDALEAKLLAGRAEASTQFVDAGLLRWKKEKGVSKLAKHMAVIKKRMADAYGCGGTCTFCKGKGKVPSPIAKLRTCGRKCTGQTCEPCEGTGERWDKLVNCKPCDATGYDLSTAQVPRSDGEGAKCKPCKATGTLPSGEQCDECEGSGRMMGIATGRDPLYESGDELLTNFAAWLEDLKNLETNIPWLRGTDDDDVQHRDVPITLSPNVLLETGRVSYSGVVLMLPRKGGVRDCIVARPGRLFVSVDYEAGELVTHGESGIRLVGYSKLAEALNDGVKVHNALAATVLGQTYEEYQALFKRGHKGAIDTRQACKPPNFGFPGRMGAAKLVIQQRKQGPDTACANGSTMITITDENGNDVQVRGFKGLRFCVLMDNAPSCGDVKITEWKSRPISPTCKHCIECAERLRAKWLEQWPENVTYFEIVKNAEEFGQEITDAQRGVLQEGEYYYSQSTGKWHLNPGEILQHGSDRIRGGKMGAESIGNAIANGWFQGLLADATKSALRRASRECYDSTYRLPDGSVSPLYGARVILFAHDELIAELFEHNAHEAAHRISVIMVEELRKYCPHMTKACAAEPALMRRWYKGAAPLYKNPAGEVCKPTDPGARLVPWEPKKAVA